MSKREKCVVATRAVDHGVVKPGKILGEYRKPEFAFHAIPGLARQFKLPQAELAVFSGDTVVTQEISAASS